MDKHGVDQLLAQHLLSVHPNSTATSGSRLLIDADVQPSRADDILFEFSPFIIIFLDNNGLQCGINGNRGGAVVCKERDVGGPRSGFIRCRRRRRNGQSSQTRLVLKPIAKGRYRPAIGIVANRLTLVR